MVDKFIKDGWEIIDFPEPEIIFKIARDLRKRASCNLQDIHIFCEDDAKKRMHTSLSEHFWSMEYSLEIAKAMLPVVQQFIGLDVMVQYMPYLRVARPNKPQDNIGYHKDTQYGQNPYEIAVHIPFVELDDKSALQVISGSHVMPECIFQRVTADGAPIEKGSIDNRMGRPYMPKCLAIPESMETTPLAMDIGKIAIFSPAIFHGQEVNEGNVTRVSCDLRFISARAPVEIRIGKIHAGYVPISQSPVEKVAEQYYMNQKGFM